MPVDPARLAEVEQLVDAENARLHREFLDSEPREIAEARAAASRLGVTILFLEEEEEEEGGGGAGDVARLHAYRARNRNSAAVGSWRKAYGNVDIPAEVIIKTRPSERTPPVSPWQLAQDSSHHHRRPCL